MYRLATYVRASCFGPRLSSYSCRSASTSSSTGRLDTNAADEGRNSSSTTSSRSPPGLKVLVSGGSGLIGTALRQSLGSPKLGNSFHPDIYQLVRRPAQNDREIRWDPYEGYVNIEDLEGFDAFVHLAGENVGSGEGLLAFTGRWTERKKHHIMESRRRGTRLLARAIASLDRPPKVLVSASGVGYYGSQGDRILTEESPQGEGFMAAVAGVWERETRPVLENSVRVVNLRFGMVLSQHGGPLHSMLVPFNLGLGGPMGPGSQYMSYISLNDAVRGIEHCIRRREISGPVNMCTPNPVQNKDFAKGLGRQLCRPAILPMPTSAVQTIFGEMGEELLLASQRAVPSKLLDSGFRFINEDIESSLNSALSSDDMAGV